MCGGAAKEKLKSTNCSKTQCFLTTRGLHPQKATGKSTLATPWGKFWKPCGACPAGHSEKMCAGYTRNQLLFGMGRPVPSLEIGSLRFVGARKHFWPTVATPLAQNTHFRNASKCEMFLSNPVKLLACGRRRDVDRHCYRDRPSHARRRAGIPWATLCLIKASRLFGVTPRHQRRARRPKEPTLM